MLFTNPRINDLPDLMETVKILSDIAGRFPVVHRGPFDPFVANGNMGVLTRTVRQFSIKPNITDQGVLFGWWNNFRGSDSIRPTLFQDSNPNYLVENVVREDFEIIMDSHPLYRLLKYGIKLPDSTRRLRIFNPYGLSHSYGFKSPFISLTSSIDIAAFHASHNYNEETGSFDAITDNSRTGLIFIFELNAPFGMIPGLSTVGKQAFLRPGRNNLFVFDCNKDTLFANLSGVKGFQFRHSYESSQHFARLFNNGLDLYPREIISEKAVQLRRRRIFSEQAFENNLLYNPKDSREENRRKLLNAGLKPVKNNDLKFTRNELKATWFNDVVGNWERFWDNVFCPMYDVKQYSYLITLPTNENYKKYFIPELWFEHIGI